MAGLLALLSHIITSLSALQTIMALPIYLADLFPLAFLGLLKMHLAFMEREGSTGVFGLALVKRFFEARLPHVDDS